MACLHNTERHIEEHLEEGDVSLLVGETRGVAVRAVRRDERDDSEDALPRMVTSTFGVFTRQCAALERLGVGSEDGGRLQETAWVAIVDGDEGAFDHRGLVRGG